MSSLDPVASLRRIAYLLERDGAESYKVRAFRHAAAAVAEVPADELGSMTLASLQKIPGVGKTSAQVIVEAARGTVPTYLQKLESDDAAPISDDASALLAKLQGDCHSHSDWSDGGSPIDEMAVAAKALGHHYWALTDHSPRLTVAHGLDAERLRRQLEVVAELNAQLAPFRILTGIEVDILEDGSLDQADDLLAQLDVVVASVHSKLRMDEREMTERMLRGFAVLIPTSSGTAPGGSSSGAAVPSRPSMPKPSSVPVRRPAPRSRSTRGPSVSTRPRICSRSRFLSVA